MREREQREERMAHGSGMTMTTMRGVGNGDGGASRLSPGTSGMVRTD